MPVSALLAPIASATIVNVFLFALLWRGDRAEARTRRLSLPYRAALILYPVAVAALFIAVKDKPVTSSAVVFVIASGAEVMGGLIAAFLRHAFITTRGDPLSERVFAMAGSLFLAGIMLAGALLN